MEYEQSQKVKRTQRDYSFPFKMMVVNEVEKGQLTYKQAQEKYGIQGRSHPELHSYEAVQEGLNLYPRMAQVLFDYSNYADEEFTGPETVAERIRGFCRASEDELQNLIFTYDDH